MRTVKQLNSWLSNEIWKLQEQAMYERGLITKLHNHDEGWADEARALMAKEGLTTHVSSRRKIETP